MNNKDKRVFPRMQLNCPVLYRQAGEKTWNVGKMQNLSATGIQFICKDDLQPSTAIHIQVKAGSKKTIPQIIASGKVVRSEPLDEGQYVLSCNLTQVSNLPRQSK
jgi:hypothetical protein